MRLHSTPFFASFALLAMAGTALADDPPAPAPDPEQKSAPPTPKEQLPPPTSTQDPAPPVASPDVTLPPGGVVSQAGIGGPTAYGRPGVLELGGSAGLMIAPDFRTVNFSPMIGWFVAENLELSAILGVSNIKAGDESRTLWSAVVEPSYHLPFNRTTFAFMGLGIGAAYENQMGTGLAIAPRIGMNLLVGRSGILTPSLSYEYTTHDVERVNVGDMRDVTVLSVSSALRINVGYTAMW